MRLEILANNCMVHHILTYYIIRGEGRGERRKGRENEEGVREDHQGRGMRKGKVKKEWKGKIR